MKRPFCVLGLTLALATWAAFFFSARQALLLSGAAAVTGALAAAFRRRNLRALCVVCFAAAVALALHALHEVGEIEPFLAADGDTVELQGLVTAQRRGRRTVYYTVAAQFPERPDLPEATVTVREYGDLEFLPGDAVRCRAWLTPKQQPGRGLRYAADEFLEAAILPGTAERLEGAYPLRGGVIRLRERLARNVYGLLHPTSADIVTAMVLGMKDNVGAETYAAVNRAGTAHLLSVSGLHLSVLTALVLRVLERLRVPNRPRILLTIAAALAFSLLVGFSASILRAFAMTAITLAAGLSRRRGDSLSALGFAVTVICLLRPGWVLGRGFWLSAGSTLGILLFAGPLTDACNARLLARNRAYNRVVGAAVSAAAVSVAAYAVTLPFLVLFNGWVSLVSPLANVLVTPFVPVVIVGGIICAAVGGTSLPIRVIAWLTDACTAIVLRVSEITGSLPFATAPLDEVWMLLWLALAVAMLAVLCRFRADRRLAGYAALLLVVVFGAGSLTQAAGERGRVELAMILECDAAVLLQGGDAVILGTPEYYEVNRLLRYLEFRGVRRVRAVVAADCGEQVGSGLPRLAARYPIDCIVGPDDAYILSQLALAVPDVPVYAGGYAALGALGAQITLTVPGGDIVVTARESAVLKTVREYAIIEVSDLYAVQLYPDGNTVLHGARGVGSSPIGRMLYGETRIRLRVDGG